MARELESFPPRRRASKYPWEEWLNGRPWLLRHGEDYTVSSASMRASVARKAKELGKQVRTQASTDDDGTEALIIQAVSKE
jgi:hypothetical protein